MITSPDDLETVYAIALALQQWTLLFGSIWQVIFDWSLHEQEHHKVIKLEMKSAYDSWREKGMVTRRLLDRLWEFGFEEPHLKAFLLRLGAGKKHLVHV